MLAGENPDGGGAAGDEQNLLPAANPALVRELLEVGLGADRLGEQLSAAGASTCEPVVVVAGAAGGGASAGESAAGQEGGGKGGRGGGGRVAAAREEFLAAVRGAAAAAGFGDVRDDDVRGGGGVPLLWTATAELKGACLAALESPAAAISGSFRWSPAFPLVAAGVNGQGGCEEQPLEQPITHVQSTKDRIRASRRSFSLMVSHAVRSDIGSSACSQ